MKLRITLLTIVVAAILQAAPAAAEPLTYPNGPWVTTNQVENISAIRTYDQLIDALENIVNSSQGATELAYAEFPAKGSGRPVPYVKIGKGKKSMVVITEQHGDEYITSNGMVALIRTLSANSKEAKFIREQVSLYVMPRSNIDGFDWTPIGEPWRYNVDPTVCTTGTCPPFYGRGQGYDINRYNSFWIDYPYANPNKIGANGLPVPGTETANPVPESKNNRWVYNLAGGANKVDVVIDLHGQATPITADGDMVTVSSLWPTATPTADQLGIRPAFDAAAVKSKKVIAVAMKAWSEAAHAHASMYVGGQEPGIARNAYGLLGSASVLMEHRGVGQKAGGYMENISYNAVLAVVTALADGSLDKADPSLAETLPAHLDTGASLFWKCMFSRTYTLENYNFCREKTGRTPVATLPPWPWSDLTPSPGPGEVIAPEVAEQLLYELTTE